MADTITITDLAEVREGDWVVLDHPSYGRIEGEARHLTKNRALFVAGICIVDVLGGLKHNADLVEARRPKPILPTEASLIRATTADGALLLLGPDLDGDWRGIGTDYYEPDKIADFEVLWTEGES